MTIFSLMDRFNEEMIESLFGYAPAEKNKNELKKESSSQDPSNQYNMIIDPKKAQNLSILLRALNVTIEEVCDALHEGDHSLANFQKLICHIAIVILVNHVYLHVQVIDDDTLGKHRVKNGFDHEKS